MGGEAERTQTLHVTESANRFSFDILLCWSGKRPSNFHSLRSKSNSALQN